MKTNKQTIKNAKVAFSDSGSGQAIVLLHGFMESMEIWERYSKKLSEKFRVVCIDLPGHGQSDLGTDLVTVESIAERVNEVLKSLKIKKCSMVGHSMGGYVSLAFLDKYPKKLNSICLFHSSALPDADEKKKDRTKAMGVAKENKSLFINQVLPNLFAEGNKEIYKKDFDKLVAMAMGMKEEAIIAGLATMRDRPDRTSVLQNAPCPVFFIAGKQDKIIPLEKLLPLLALPAHAEALILDGVGHLGFIEAEKECLRRLMTIDN